MGYPSNKAAKDSRSPEQRLLDTLDTAASPYCADTKMGRQWFAEAAETLRKLITERDAARVRAEGLYDDMVRRGKDADEAQKELRIVTKQRDEWQRQRDDYYRELQEMRAKALDFESFWRQAEDERDQARADRDHNKEQADKFERYWRTAVNREKPWGEVGSDNGDAVKWIDDELKELARLRKQVADLKAANSGLASAAVDKSYTLERDALIDAGLAAVATARATLEKLR